MWRLAKWWPVHPKCPSAKTCARVALPAPLQKPTPTPTLTVATSSDSIAVTTADEVVLTVTISNEGTVDVTGVTFKFTPPAEATWTIDPADPVCTLNGTSGEYTCDLGDLAQAAAPATITITGTPAGAASFAIAGAVAATNVDPADCTNCNVNVAVDITAA